MKDIYLCYILVLLGLLIVPIVILMIFFFQIGNRIIGFAFIIIIIINIFMMGVIAFMLDTIIPRKYPNYEDPHEIKKIKTFLERKEIMNFIRTLYFGYGSDIAKIGSQIEKKFNVEIIYHKGNKRFRLKSKELVNQIVNILGFKSYREYYLDYHENRKEKRFNLI